jgi:hypothetical protein
MVILFMLKRTVRWFIIIIIIIIIIKHFPSARCPYAANMVGKERHICNQSSFSFYNLLPKIVNNI